MLAGRVGAGNGTATVIVTVAWLVALSAGLAWELCCRQRPGRWASLATVSSWMWQRRGGRVVLVAIWAFVGWHFFSRYTVPR